MSQDRKAPKKVVIVRRKKAHAHAHHGGSWKVAYADFVTAMMAFFMVMWILGMDEQTKKAIESYFASPVGQQKAYSGGSSPISSGSSPAAVPTAALRLIVQSRQKEGFERARDRLNRRLAGPDGVGGIGARVEIVVSQDGLRIELVEGGDGEAFFPFGSPAMKPPARRALRLIAAELVALSNPVVVEGHTDAAPFGARGGYSNWELSAERANAARRVLEGSGLDPRRVVEVRGLGDRQLRRPDLPLDPSNRRISILLPFVLPPEPAAPVRSGAV